MIGFGELRVKLNGFREEIHSVGVVFVEFHFHTTPIEPGIFICGVYLEYADVVVVGSFSILHILVGLCKSVEDIDVVRLKG